MARGGLWLLVVGDTPRRMHLSPHKRGIHPDVFCSVFHGQKPGHTNHCESYRNMHGALHITDGKS